MAIDMEELESPSESEEVEWCPEKNESGRNRKSSNVKKPKATGVRTDVMYRKSFSETGATLLVV